MDSLDMQKYRIKQGDNLGLIFAKHGFSAAQTDHICHEITEVIDPTKLQAGMSYYLFTDRDSLSTIKNIVFAKSLTDFAVLNFENDQISAQKYNKPIKLVPQYIEGSIFSSLWNTIDATGASPLLALKLSNVFAW
ncbi:MAG: metalloendopeptidase, partial [Massilibacteroides sp.]|nr:metalloendopeptidase [Massilibacteroides sp.]